MLWRTRLILCTDQGTAVWTNSYPTHEKRPDLQLFHPPAVGEKNFHGWIKITPNGPGARRDGASM